MDIKLEVDAKKLTKVDLPALEKQAKFAMAKTLTGAAFHSRQSLQRYLGIWLQIKRPFLPKSIVVEKATPNKLYAEVGFLDRARLVPLLEKGGTRRPHSGKNIAIPTDNVKRTGRGSISKAKRPAALLKKKNHFHAVLNGTNGIWEKKGNNIRLVYLFEPNTEYDKGTIQFYKTVDVLAPRYIRRELLRNLDRAIATRKR